MKTLAYTRTGGKYKRPGDDPELQRLRDIRNGPRKNYIHKAAYKSAGSFKIFYALPKSERLRLRAIATEKYWALRTTPTKGMARPDLPKIYKEDKLPKPIPTKSDEVKEGYVYIFQDMMKPNGVYKIGSTDDVGGRLSNARTWGEFRCVRWFYSGDCKMLEKNTHNELSEFRINKDDMGDEWFRITKATAISKIQELSNAATTV